MLEGYPRGAQIYGVRTILEACPKFLAGRLSAVEVSGKLCGFHPLDATLDPYLGLFVEVSDQAFDVRYGGRATHWNRDALANMDADVARIEAEYRERVAAPCGKLVEILAPV